MPVDTAELALPLDELDAALEVAADALDPELVPAPLVDIAAAPEPEEPAEVAAASEPEELEKLEEELEEDELEEELDELDDDEVSAPASRSQGT